MNASETETIREECDVCIVGAGIAGMNAAAVASQYLSREQKIILVDRRPRAGGMWVDTYPYVRLHQPHPLFTAGNLTWALDKSRSYLATKPEVLDHFTHCLDAIKQRVQVKEYFGWTVDSHTESADGNHITARSEVGMLLEIEAKRVIKANGFAINPNRPLPVSTENIHSVSPDFLDFRNREMRANSTPIWVVGGGKTAMDTVLAAMAEYPGREVNLIAGAGTYFTNRDDMFPSGGRRWWRGTLPNRVFSDIALRFDGTNEDEVREWFQRNHGVCPIQPARRYLVGLLSEAEAAKISAGLNTVDMDYLDDVVDHPSGVQLRYQSGQTRTIPAGSWLVNCSGYVLRNNTEYEPYVSPLGSAVSINTRSATLGFTTYAAYFLTHLLFLGKLSRMPLYEVDFEDLSSKSREMTWIAMSLGQYNLSLIYDAVPSSVFRDCGVDFDRWYPLPRRMLGSLRFMRTHHRDREHHRQTLDTVRERFDVRCGPLPQRITSSRSS